MANQLVEDSGPSHRLAIRRAEEKDLEECAICYGERQITYTAIYPKKLRRSDITLEERLQANVESLRAELDSHNKVFHVAVVPGSIERQESERVVGYSIWQMPDHVARRLQATNETSEHQSRPSTKSQCLKEIESECDMDLARRIEKETVRVKLEYCGRESWFLHQLFINPNYQRRGVGTKLIDHGLAYIEQQDGSTAKIGLTSSPQGEPLYKRYGFREVYRFRPSVTDYNDQGELVKKNISWPLMLRHRALVDN